MGVGESQVIHQVPLSQIRVESTPVRRIWNRMDFIGLELRVYSLLISS